MEPSLKKAYADILHEEISSAVGCTEPIAIALCAAKAQQALGMQPTAVTVSVSADVLRSAKSVVVPHTKGLTGIRAAVAAGILCGDAGKGLQVLGEITPEQRAAVVYFAETTRIDVATAETDCPIYISVTLYARTSYARAVIANRFTNVTEVMKNGEVLFSRPIHAPAEDHRVNRSCLNVRDIFDYAAHADLSPVRALLFLQTQANAAIAEEGMHTPYGAEIGRTLLSANGDAGSMLKAYAAAASDARTGGCEREIAALCGSMSAGIAVSVPVVLYARQHGIADERMQRALLFADLLTVYQNAVRGAKPGYCSAVNAGCALGAAIAYLTGADEAAVLRTFQNAIELRADTVCDGAKASCSLKIAAAVEAGLVAFETTQKQPASDDALANIDDAIRSALNDDPDAAMRRIP